MVNASRPHGALNGPSDAGPGRLACLGLGVGLGTLLGAVAGLSALGPLFPYYGLIALILGAGLGLLMSPILLAERQRPFFYKRFALTSALGLLVAATAGLVPGILSAGLVAVTVVGSFVASSELFEAGGKGSLRRTLTWPAVTLLGVGVHAYLSRLPDDEGELITLMAANAAEVSAAATQKLIDGGGVAPMLEALEHADPEVRESAARTLCQFPVDDVAPALLDAIDDESRRVRIAALGSLFHLGVEQPLIDALADPDPTVRLGLCFRIGWCGDASHIAALERLLDDPDERVREQAARTIASVRDKDRPH